MTRIPHTVMVISFHFMCPPLRICSVCLECCLEKDAVAALRIGGRECYNFLSMSATGKARVVGIYGYIVARSRLRCKMMTSPS